ncbi:MAG: hypothetical protein HPY62_11300 [Bacteroidales bacterium]|nr:hypothetical protein [Bacteroidales bacterium]
MKTRSALILLIILLLQVSCKKDDAIPTSGIATINNTTEFSTTYYVYGFLFSEAKLVSTLDKPAPDITVDSDGTNLLLQTNNFKNSFFLFGEYNSETSAKAAFDNLSSANVTQWEGLAYPLKVNQIWIYRSGTEKYAKIRIISLLAELRSGRNYAECTFEWVYQPDGSLTFPVK